MSEDQGFVTEMRRLAAGVELRDPSWAQDLRDEPAVYAPHPTYGDGPDCCHYSFDHPIHAVENVAWLATVRDRIRAARGSTLNPE